MATVTSNLPEVKASLDTIGRAFNFHSPGRYKTLGQDVMDLLAETIYEQTVLRQRDEDNTFLAPLAPSTKAAKSRKGQPDTIGVATGEMLSLDQIKGNRTIFATSATVIYGDSDSAQEKATYFQEGSRRKKRKQRPRRFFGVNALFEKAMDDLMDDVLDLTIRRAGG